MQNKERKHSYTFSYACGEIVRLKEKLKDTEKKLKIVEDKLFAWENPGKINNNLSA